MGRSRVRSSIFVVVGLIVFSLAMICLAGFAGLMAGLGPHALQARSLSADSLHDESVREDRWRTELLNPASPGAPDATPAAVIEQRFAWDRADEPGSAATSSVGTGSASQAAASLMTADATNVLPVTDMTLFSPSLSYPGVAPSSNAAPSAPERPAVAAAAVPAPSHAQTAAAIRRQVAANFGNVLNDAQIASIKKRLKLTPDQEQMWPAVEVALRRIAYKTAAAARRRPPANDVASAGHQHSGLLAYIDPESDEVRQLKYAAIPLIMRLNDEQKREVRSLAHVMGLEGVASEF
jgi:hypothetical protein